MTDSIDCFLAQNERQAYRMAQMSTGSSDDALDIVQDAMIKLVQKYSHRPSNEWGPLFHRIVQRQITDWYRRNSIKQRLFHWFSSTDDLPALDEFEAPLVSQPDNLLQNHQAIELLQIELQQLPLRQRQAFLLRCWQGLDTAETAKAMSCSSGSVKTHYHRALKTLRSKLEGTWQ
ncbi:MAG: RNA polymerase sigma factor [Methylococcaceae bacterium]|nr:RNA polymerase sigma factor [Methylococcaceae bacterium]